MSSIRVFMSSIRAFMSSIRALVEQDPPVTAAAIAPAPNRTAMF